MKEQSVWTAASIEPRGKWYISAGAGMAAALRMANEKRAYTLADRGTFLAHRNRLELRVLSKGDRLLRNPYVVIVVSAKRHPGVRVDGAKRFADFLMSPKVQTLIEKFGVDKYGQPLFFPHAKSVSPKTSSVD